MTARREEPGPEPLILPDKRDRARIFHRRVEEAMDKAGTNRARLARRIGIDPSTLSQLLSPGAVRLPRADTAAAIAAALGVSLDWLLGLTQDQKSVGDIMAQSFQIAPTSRSPVDRRLEQWHQEAAGYKIRYVPTSLPDFMKTDAVLQLEYEDFVAVSPHQARHQAEERLAYARTPESDMEACSPVQLLEGLAKGEGIWRHLSPAERLGQLDRMAELVRELYPTFRWFLFDQRSLYSVPVTIFGPQRAVIYVGQMFFVFNTTEHIRVLTRHFDDLIRNAVVQPTDVAGLIARYRSELAHGTLVD